VGSSDEFSEEEASETEAENIDNAINKFTLTKYKTKKDTTVRGRDSASHHFRENDF
jgi:DNA excision repair protein ERCC-3